LGFGLVAACLPLHVASAAGPAVSYTDVRLACANEGRIELHLEGQALIDFVARCVNQPSMRPLTAALKSNSSYNDRHRACVNEGKYRRRLRGESLASFVTECATMAAEPVAAAASEKREACANEGRVTTSLTGQSLIDFILACESR